MIILTLRTDKPEAEIGLYEDTRQIDYRSWEAHRQLAETLHARIRDLLEDNGRQWPDIRGIVFYEGPGSFTGLRIGASVANALASSLSIPVVGTSQPETGDLDDWLKSGIAKLSSGKSDKQVVPEYGQPVHITQQKK